MAVCRSNATALRRDSWMCQAATLAGVVIRRSDQTDAASGIAGFGYRRSGRESHLARNKATGSIRQRIGVLGEGRSSDRQWDQFSGYRDFEEVAIAAVPKVLGDALLDCRLELGRGVTGIPRIKGGAKRKGGRKIRVAITLKGNGVLDVLARVAMNVKLRPLTLRRAERRRILEAVRRRHIGQRIIEAVGGPNAERPESPCGSLRRAVVTLHRREDVVAGRRYLAAAHLTNGPFERVHVRLELVEGLPDRAALRRRKNLKQDDAAHGLRLRVHLVVLRLGRSELVDELLVLAAAALFELGELTSEGAADVLGGGRER